MGEITGLPTREQFIREGQKLIDECDLQTSLFYIIYFNIQNYNIFNVRYGSEVGKGVIRNLADMITARFCDSKRCRSAEDHFLILTNVDRISERITEICDEFKMMYGDDDIDLKAGVCRLDEKCKDLSTACGFAKLSCDLIRDEVGKKYCYYDQDVERTISIQDYVSHSLDKAIQSGYIKVYFQPIYEADTNTLCEFEALARWDDPDKGFLSPIDFISSLEKNRQIYKLDLYVLKEICRMMRERIDIGAYVVPVSFNVSKMDLLVCDLFTEVNNILGEYNIPSNMIHLEFTESILLGDLKKVLDTSEMFREAGYQVWMDDFGEGYSTLNLLDNCDFDLIKLDMGFLKRFNEKSRIIIENLIIMAKKLGIKILAEGVETKEQYDFLRSVGCEKVQGYFLGKPMESQLAIELLKSV